MIIADNLIKHHFQNVYIVTGGACGGKTTVTRYLADKYDLVLYNWDEHFPKYQALATPQDQPAMSQRPNFTSWEEYFMRPVEEFSQWSEETFQEQTGMVILDLVRLAGSVGDKRIIVDGFFSAALLKKISSYNKVAILMASEEVVRHDYFNREDKMDMLACIQGLKDPEAAIENVFRTMFHKVDEFESSIVDSGFKYFKRESLETDPRELNRLVEEHFGF